MDLATCQAPFMSKLQKLALRLTILAFGIAAAMGIGALLIGEFGDLQGRVLLTTLSIGVMSLAMLCYLAPKHTRFIQLGIVGFITATITLLISLFLIWEDRIWTDLIGLELIVDYFVVMLVVSATIAQICLLAAMVRASKSFTVWLFRFTMLMAVVLAAMIITLILSEPSEVEWFIRTLGVVAILDAFGTVTLIAVRLFTGSPASEKATINPYTQRLIAEAAAERGVTAQQVLDEAINVHITNATAASQAPPRGE